METVKKIGGLNFANVGSGTYAIGYNVDTAEQSLVMTLNNYGNWETEAVNIGGVRIVPWGADNNLPAYIRQLLEKKTTLDPQISNAASGCNTDKDRTFIA